MSKTSLEHEVESRTPTAASSPEDDSTPNATSHSNATSGAASTFRAAGILAATLGLLACGGPESETPNSASSAGGEIPVDESELANPALLRAGLIAPGDYLFELSRENGNVERRRGTLVGLGGTELMVRIDQQSQRLSRRAAWPMLCLDGALEFGDGDLRVRLESGAPVYVIAADSVSARVGPTPTGLSEIIRRQHLSLDNCSDEVAEVENAHEVGIPRAGTSACLFPDQDPLDDRDGLTVAAGAPLEVLEDDGRWSRVRVGRARGALEGWIDSNLIAEAGNLEEDPDWCDCALRPDPCDLPDREPSQRTSRAWVESTNQSTPMPSAERMQAALEAADPQVRGCWDELPRERKPDQTARVEVRLDIDGDGEVWRSAVVRRQNAPISLARCVLERASRVRFPHSPGSLSVRYQYAFDPEPDNTVVEETQAQTDARDEAESE